VFSLGVVLWEMTVGERLYGGNDESELATLKSIVERDAPLPSSKRAGYPPELERIVMTALARDRHARFATADAFQVELETLARAKGWWSSAREMATFMASAFPDRAKAWQDSERRGTAPIVSSPRLTTPLPTAPPTAESRPNAIGTRNPPPAAAPAVAATAPMIGRTSAIVIAVAIAALAIVIGFVFGRQSSPAAPTTPTTATTGHKPVPSAPGTEDADFFLPDDYLVSHTPYHGERLDTLWVAKMLEPPAGANTRTHFLDANGKDLATEAYWKSRIAIRDDLAIGAMAFCQAPSYLRHAEKPKDRAFARTQPWMLGRVTDVSKLDAGQVSVADVVCDVDGVRVPVE